MGTHPSGPSKVKGSGTPLKDWLKQNPTAVGKVPAGYGNEDLPFLFKVLSIKTALSIQVGQLLSLSWHMHNDNLTWTTDIGSSR
jgi:mannose-6-phosphate isomerase